MANATAQQSSTSSGLSDLSPTPLSVTALETSTPSTTTKVKGTRKSTTLNQQATKSKIATKPRQSIKSTTSESDPNGKTKGADRAGARQKKRKSEVGDEVENGSTKKPKVDGGEKGFYCHQCRQKCDSERSIRCTRIKPGPGGRPKICNLAWCDRDLHVRYDIDGSSIREGGGLTPAGKDMEHDMSKGYTFICPHCRDKCLSSPCVKKKENATDESITKAPTTLDIFDDDLSELSDVEDHVGTDTKPNKSTRTLKSKIKYNSNKSPTKGSTKKKVSSRSPTKISTKKKTETVISTPSKHKTKPTTSTPSKSMKSSTKTQAIPIKSASKTKSTPSKSAGKTSTTPSKVTSASKSVSQKANAAGKGDAKGKAKGKGKAQEQEREKPKRVISDEAKARMRERAKERREKNKIPVVEPPVFEKVDTKLGREEAENRIYLREYVYRFRAVLGLPDRFLGPLDDFDRPLSEASVRLLGGALLDIIRDHYEQDELQQELVEAILQHREELRYYADLARFQNIYNNLSNYLKLTPPAAPPPTIDRNTSAIRALLDLGENDATPDWAIESSLPSRRTGASRIPQPGEIVRMLISLMEETLNCRRIRFELDSAWGEWEVRRGNSSAVLAENKEWEKEKKGIMVRRLKCKSGEEAKKVEEELKQAEKEFNLRISLLNHNLRATLATKALRFEPLGVDLDGRVYYQLTPRPISEDSRPPVGWASGLLVWGIGVPPKAEFREVKTNGTDAASTNEAKLSSTAASAFVANELPYIVERWTHFGKSSAVYQLRDWYASKILIEHEKAKKAEESAAAKAKHLKGIQTPTKVPPKGSKLANSSTRDAKNCAAGKGVTSVGKGAPSVVVPLTGRRESRPSVIGLSTPDIDSLSSQVADGSVSKETTGLRVQVMPGRLVEMKKDVKAIPNPTKLIHELNGKADGDDDSDLSSVSDGEADAGEKNEDEDEESTTQRREKREQREEKQKIEEERLKTEQEEKREQERKMDLQSLINPKGYEEGKCAAKIMEGMSLVEKLKEVADWLALLEWKGMGEIS